MAPEKPCKQLSHAPATRDSNNPDKEEPRTDISHAACDVTHDIQRKKNV